MRTKQRSKKDRFKVRTVTAIVGVRGTEFVIGTGIHSGTNVTNVAVLPEFGGPGVMLTYTDPELAELPGTALGVAMASQLRGGERGWTKPIPKTTAQLLKFAKATGNEILNDEVYGPSESIGAIQERLKSEDKTRLFEEESDEEGELLDRLDRLEELETIVENAENAIDAATSKNLILSMTFTNR